jgi:hypothetical protein
VKFVYDKTRPPRPPRLESDASAEAEGTEYRFWARRTPRGTAARPALKGE